MKKPPGPAAEPKGIQMNYGLTNQTRFKCRP